MDNYDNRWNEDEQFRENAYQEQPYSYVQNSVAYDMAEDREDRAREVLGKTFAYMVLAMILSAMSALYVYHSSFVYVMLFNRAIFYGLLIAELIVVVAANSAISKQNVPLSACLFFVYSIINGITLSVIFLLYTGSTILSVFILAAVVFGVMAVIGLTTKANLNGVGAVGMMLLVGVVSLGIFNLFIRSSALDLAVTVVGLAVFIGLTMYDTKKIKEMSYEDTESSTAIIAIFGALQLYLDFINIFLKLLRLLGSRRN